MDLGTWENVTTWTQCVSLMDQVNLVYGDPIYSCCGGGDKEQRGLAIKHAIDGKNPFRRVQQDHG